MRVSMNWLKDYVAIDVSVEELCRQLTMLGLEIERVERPGEEIQQVYVGQVLTVEPHPDADKLSVCTTDVGGEAPLQIVCGAKNMKPGDKVPTAIVGATLPGGFAIARRKMRGVESQGMMCSAQELGLGEDQEGLLILDPSLPVGFDAKVALGLDDVILEIEVTPNRGDWASMIGVARELAAVYGINLRIPKIRIAETGTPAAELSSVTLEDPDCCPRYLGRVLSNVRVGPSPAWLCKRLVAAGQRPINNVVDVTNYVQLETGHPLHAFDYDKLAGNRIVVRRARPGEKMHTLDDQERTLSEDMLVIADAVRPQAVAGIMGGAESEVGEGTRILFLESAYFHPPSIRATSRMLGLVSESSQRFQRGADPEMAAYAIDRAAMLLQGLAGADLAPGRIDAYPNPLPERTARLRYRRPAEFLGQEVSPEFQRQCLERLGFVRCKYDDEGADFLVPSWRHDVSMEADLLEEIGRLYGYDKIPVSLPAVRGTDRIYAPEERRIRKLRDFLVGLGLTERFLWTFTSAADLATCRLDAVYSETVLLANPLSEKQAMMRPSLLPGLLANVAENIRHGNSDLATFEIGPVYLPVGNGELPRQHTQLALVIVGKRARHHWSAAPPQVDFFDAKGLGEAVALHFRREFGIESAEFVPLQAGHSAALTLDGRCIGHFGKLSSAVKKNLDIDQDLFVVDLDLSSLVGRPVPEPQFEEVPTFPISLRDLAVVVPEELPAGVLLDTARRAGGRLLKSVQIFDVFSGPQVGAGRKSVALGFVFQSQERTLTDNDTQKAIEKILKQLQSTHKAVLR